MASSTNTRWTNGVVSRFRKYMQLPTTLTCNHHHRNEMQSPLPQSNAITATAIKCNHCYIN
jgi:hypothetical protein